ncbi:MAG: FkbM family methyltransferase [Candidatus Sulfotelmatobacter sp.]
MPAVRSLAKSCIVFLLGKESKPRRILAGLASGYRISVSPVDNLGYLLGANEAHLQRAIRQYVAPGDAAYDVGANIGYVSLSLAKRVGPQGCVIAFEPVPQNIAAFRSHITINGITNVCLFECAASDRAGEAVIRLAESSSTASLVWHRDNSFATEISIRTVSIDDLVDAGDIPSPKFVKIDVEGAEGSVLEGMRRTIASARPVLFVECSEVGRQTAWPLLVSLNYRCQSAITRKEVTRFEEYRHSDFLWLPAEKL